MSKLTLIIRVLLSSAVLLAAWSLLTMSATTLIDDQAVIRWLGENDWLKLLNADIRNVILTRGWQPLAALVIAVLSYRSLKAPAIFLANKISPPTSCVLSDNAKAIVRALYRPDYIRREAGLAKELGIDQEDIAEGLNELLANGLVVERKKRTGTFWKITFAGQKYLDQLDSSSR